MKMKRLTLAMAAIGYVSLIQSVSAEEETAKKAERIEVTGSSIKRIAKEGSVPVQTFSKTEIAKTGAVSVTELIQKLPAIQGFTAVSQSAGGGGNGFGGASIHNVGETRTLVLLNGRRVATFAGQEMTGALAGIDLNTIPLAAVERVEVLTDGASALYGSDAVAGVINFILRNNQTAGDVSVSISHPSSDGGGEKRFSIVKGFGNLQEDGFNILASFSHDQTKQLKATDRDFAKTGILHFDHEGQPHEFFNGSTRGVPANVLIGGVLKNPYLVANGKCPPTHQQVGTACYFDYTSTIEINPEAKRDNFLLSVNKSLGDKHTLFADAMISRFQVTSRIAPAPVDIPVPTTSPFYSIAQSLGATGDVSARWRAVDAGNRTSEDENVAKHLNVGLRGTLAGWDYTTSLTHSVNEWTQTHLAGWLKRNELKDALDSGLINPFVEPGGQSAAGKAAIEQALSKGKFKERESSLTFFGLHGSRELMEIAGGSVQMGAGINAWREGTKYTPGELAKGVANGIAGDDSQDLGWDKTRNAWGTFAEIVAPVIKDLELTGSLRHDRYQKIGGSTNYKLSVRYQPVSALLLRGSVGSGFRAPSVAQMLDVQQLFGVTGGTYDCPFSASDPLAQYCQPPGSQYNVYVAGNPNLKPEKTKQWTFGFRVEPSQNASFGVDIWSVNLKDTIGQIQEDVVFGNAQKYRDLYILYTDPLSNATNLAILLKNNNLGKKITRGIDFDSKLSVNSGVGRFGTQLIATYMLKNDYERTPGDGIFNNLGRYNDSEVTFKFSGRLINTWDVGKFSNTFTINYKSGYWDQPQDVDNLATGQTYNLTRYVAGYRTYDWQTRYAGIKSLELTFGIKNMFNTRPPFTVKTQGGHQLGFDNRYTDPLGRTFYGSASYKF
ncbi:iron complex outermembrane receptor protein [Chitinivorax tropicus]|uniref:Iron complex outermembrane receptor protein n=1 Tax=Chitinivorax tropicus TaxID=714531 RepID=A0A840MLT0_9PROT|nr:TonB-dependent receptor [Chitinivorax tropicus]MBB5020114.1 iron complex outermembrane receptor protein [Chitinivorax tropicus]